VFNGTFGKTYVIKDKAHDLHVEFHGRADTAGDVVVFCPQKCVVATGDMILGILPFLGDSYPRERPVAWRGPARQTAPHRQAQLASRS
jgi:hypothetical protein